jgi:hypothetical protein
MAGSSGSSSGSSPKAADAAAVAGGAKGGCAELLAPVRQRPRCERLQLRQRRRCGSAGAVGVRYAAPLMALALALIPPSARRGAGGAAGRAGAQRLHCQHHGLSGARRAGGWHVHDGGGGRAGGAVDGAPAGGEARQLGSGSGAADGSGAAAGCSRACMGQQQAHATNTCLGCRGPAPTRSMHACAACFSRPPTCWLAHPYTTDTSRLRVLLPLLVVPQRVSRAAPGLALAVMAPVAHRHLHRRVHLGGGGGGVVGLGLLRGDRGRRAAQWLG